MTTPLLDLRVVPAQLSFLTIYNPSLAKSDETFRDQILFYYSRSAREAKAASKVGGAAQTSENELQEQENERLRQVGLAQGMVDFARTFANGQALDSVETEKSRIIMRELENGWWVLASVDLTRLPKARAPVTETSKASAGSDADLYEYSSREVSPPALLIQQILTAHRIFLLHHGPSLTDLLLRNGRDKLSTILERFWVKFCVSWEVLLHGNPAVEVLGAAKLAAGGELGMGVGEEDWGSGERDVLEDLVHRTEGLVDLVVSRFGEGPGDSISSDDMPWIGRGQSTEASDGVIFSGVGAITRESVRDISCWLQQIYAFGEYAYGVRDNPSRKRQRRTRPKLTQHTESETSIKDAISETAKGRRSTNSRSPQRARDAGVSVDKPPHITGLPHDPRPAMHDRVASHDHAPGSPSMRQPLEDHKPSIPPPIVVAAENALAKATLQAEQQASQTPPIEESSQQSGPMVSDKWVKYLTLGLSTLVKSENVEGKNARPAPPTRLSTGKTSKLSIPRSNAEGGSGDEALRTTLTQLDPMPDGYLAESQIALQKQLETQGYFLIGYRGLIEPQKGPKNGTRHESDKDDEEDQGGRLLLRTIHVGKTHHPNNRGGSDNSNSLDGSSVQTVKPPTKIFERVRVVIYVRQPFVYAFLFEQRATTLQMPSFYMSTHEHLMPLHRPMSQNTSSAHIARLFEDSKFDSAEPDSSSTGPGNKKPSPIFDLLFDPRRLTVHSTIPNIPLPGTSAAEGLSSYLQKGEQASTWTRIDGLSVHSQILNTIESAKYSSREIERSAKTNRGWWVVWMRLAPSEARKAVQPSNNEQTDTAAPDARSDEHDTDQCRVALLVRKASDWTAPKAISGSSRTASGMFGFGRSGDTSGGANGSWGPSGLAGGMGFDARRYVEGLLSLNR